MIRTLKSPDDLEQIHKVMNKLKSKKQPILLYAFADWCPFCQDMMNDWDSFIEENTNTTEGDVSDLFKDICVLMINDDVVRTFQTVFKDKIFTQVLNKAVKSYPTIAFIHYKTDSNIQVNLLKGLRTKESLTKFLEEEKKEL